MPKDATLSVLSSRFRLLQYVAAWIAGRKFKKFSKVKVLRALDVIALQQPAALPSESQALAQRLSFSPSQDIQFIPPLISVLQGIEPEVVYAGYDNTQPETPSALLTSLNQLCERQLLCVVKWSKSLPGKGGGRLLSSASPYVWRRQLSQSHPVSFMAAAGGGLSTNRWQTHL